MSLVSNLISGSTGNFGLIDSKKYGHETGALRIATESAEALHDIFIEGFYNMEQAELAAVHEGVALEGSQYETVIEASVSSVFSKVKEFFKKLWEKVKAFFHNIKRYIDSIFMSGKEFVKKYDADIRKATNLKDFEYKMYDYKYIDDVISIDVEDYASKLVGEANPLFSGEKSFSQIIDELSNTDDKSLSGNMFSDEVKSSSVEDVNSDMSDMDDVAAKTIAEAHSVKGVTDYSDFSESCFSHFRNGAEDKSDMDTIEISSLSEYATTLKTFNSSKLDKMATNTDKAYKKAIKQVDTLESLVNKKVKDSNVKKVGSKYLSAYSTMLSKCQSLENTYFTIWKTAAKERDSAYKSMIVKAIAYSKKRDKNK